jgi:hypothetical protein
MVTRRDYYARVNAAWPQQVPALTADEAVIAAKRLWRFATGTTPHEVRLTSGNRSTAWIGAVHARRVGASILRVNRGDDWKRLVHLLSHWAAYAAPAKALGAANASERGQHTKAHARLELRMVKQVVARGWLDGRLKPQQEEPAAAPAPQEAKARRQAADAEHARAMLAKATTRAKRAETIRRKWARRPAARERALRISEAGALHPGNARATYAGRR